jgi:hypothetical protein
MPRRFPPPWAVEQNSRWLCRQGRDQLKHRLIYARETRAEADTAKLLTIDGGGGLR